MNPGVSKSLTNSGRDRRAVHVDSNPALDRLLPDALLSGLHDLRR